MQIRPIRSDADHTAAVRRIEALMGAEPGSRRAEELDILATLVVAYEKEHYPIFRVDAITAIEFSMEQLGMRRRHLEPLIGSRARVSEVLSGRRALTLPMIRRLAAALKIPAEVLIAEPAKGHKVRRFRPATTPRRPVSQKFLRPAKAHPASAAKRAQ